jgi:hypothetical protein
MRLPKQLHFANQFGIEELEEIVDENRNVVFTVSYPDRRAIRILAAMMDVYNRCAATAEQRKKRGT